MLEIRSNLLLKAGKDQEVEVDDYLNFLQEPQNSEIYEEHHALPICIFPEFKSFKYFTWNKCPLTPKNHFLAHYKLCKIFPDSPKLLFAWSLMCKKLLKKNIIEQAEEYEVLRKAHCSFLKNRKHSEESKKKMAVAANKRYESSEERMRGARWNRPPSELSKKALEDGRRQPKTEKTLQKLKTVVVSEEGREQRRLAQKLRWEKPEEREKARLRGLGRTHTEESKQKMREHIKPPKSEETKRKISEGNRGKKASLETLQKMSQAQIGKKKGCRWMTKDEERKIVKPKDVEGYLKQGWMFQYSQRRLIATP